MLEIGASAVKRFLMKPGVIALRATKA